MAIWSNVIRWFGGGMTRQKGQQSGDPSSGAMVTATVTVETAMQLSSVWACVRLISETVAALPVRFYEVDEQTGEKRPKNDHDLARLFATKPNRYQTRVEFFETLTMQLALHGNCYCLIGRSGKKIISLMPIMANQVEVTLLDDGALAYAYNDGTTTRVFAEENIWHVKLFGNGVIGLSPLGHARNAIGLGIANERRVANMANRGFKPAGVLMIDKLLKPDQREQIRAQFSDLQTGDGDPLKVLEAGMKYQQIAMNPKDVQLLESRRFQIEDICRFFGVPSVLVNDASATTTLGSGIHQIVQGFYKLTLRPYLERYEASIKNSLVETAERRTIDVEFDFSALLRGDDETRFRTYKEAIQGGILMPDEARAREGLGPQKGGDRLYMQAQMVPLEMIRSLSEAGKTQEATT